MPENRSPVTFVQPGSLPLVHPVPQVEIQRHTFIYRSLSALNLEADIYRPATLQANQRCLAVIMIHGGPVERQANPKDWRMFKDYAALLAGLDVVTVVFNHRLYGPAEYFTAQGDVSALLEHVRVHSASYNIDPNRLLLWAFAGGGPLLTVALNPPRASICGLIAYYCVLDFAMAAKSGAPAAPREILENLSPAVQVRRNGCHAPILAVRAGRDTASSHRSLATFLEAALAGDVAIELLNHPEGEHAFDVRNDDARSREIIARTLQFIRVRATM
jgi:acetyl esterase/lipase